MTTHITRSGKAEEKRETSVPDFSDYSVEMSNEIDTLVYLLKSARMNVNSHKDKDTDENLLAASFILTDCIKRLDSVSHTLDDNQFRYVAKTN